jgi:Fe-S-cluster-containing hydrogenase component 2
VQSARKPRCIACGNCVVACPFGVPGALRRPQDHDEVRHVLRPDEPPARNRCARRCAEPGACFRHARADRAAAAAVRHRTASSSGPDDHHEGLRHGAAAKHRTLPST